MFVEYANSRAFLDLMTTMEVGQAKHQERGISETVLANHQVNREQ